jgi:uncharacterized protein (TIGR01777 family)
VSWNGVDVGDWARELEGAAAVVNLAGKSIQNKWTEENRKQIVDSRVRSTTAIGEAVTACENPPRVWINASATGFYGDRPNETLDESSTSGTGFLAETCVLWERAQDQVPTPRTAQARVRIGIVLGRGGGAYQELSALAKNFLGGSIGSGEMMTSWIHLTDLCRMFSWLIAKPQNGVFNGTAPNPVTNGELMAALRESLGRPWSPPAPIFAVKLVADLKGVEPELLLISCNALPRAAINAGFEFEFASVEEALGDLASKTG